MFDLTPGPALVHRPGRGDLLLNVDEVRSLLHRIYKQSAPMGDCWLFMGYRRNGYGTTSVRDAPVYVHQFVWSVAHAGGAPPPVVRHRCDVRTCWNPSHLLAGTQADNVRDAVERKRNVLPPVLAGEANCKATLSDDQVREVRRRVAAGATQREVATAFNCSQSTVYRLVHAHTRRSA